MAVRWAFNVGKWTPTPQEWSDTLEAISMEPDEQRRVGRFVQENDRKCALVARLLQRRLIHETFGMPWADIVVKRTHEGKPYWANMPTDCKWPLWNYNVSHHGNFVVIGSEPHGLIGMDVMRLKLLPSCKTNDKFFSDMSNCFTLWEWRDIRRGTEQAEHVSGPFNPAAVSIGMRQLDQFYRHWTLKEAYIKAVGIGLGFELQRAEFRWVDGLKLINGVLRGDGNADPVYVHIDGVRRNEWSWEILYLDEEHVASVAVGPFSASIESYARDSGIVDKNKGETTRDIDVTQPCTVIDMSFLLK